MSNINLVSIIGAGHSGSTLLDLLLGTHSRIRSLGEISHWDQYIREHKHCSCGSPPETCEFWKEVLERWEHYLATSQSDVRITDTRSNSVQGATNLLRYRLSLLLTLLFPIHKRPQVTDAVLPEFKQRTSNITELFKFIRDVSGQPIVCDSSKSVYRFRLLHAKQPQTSRAIYLTRDGRAIVASHYRRSGQSIERSARRWRFANTYTKYQIRTLPKHSYIHVRYEELCRDPEATLTRICEFLGCEFEPAMLNFSGEKQHNIGGNRMRMSGLHEIQEDLKWRDILTNEQLATFDRIAGKANDKILGPYKLQ